jgi:purine-nucleoside phosphorylase
MLYLNMRHRPQVGIICGSGLKNLGSKLEDIVEIPMSDIPYFPATKIPGHGSSLLVGRMGGVVTAILTGRIHFYEGHSLQTVIFPTRILVEMGVSTLLVTNAAGALNPSFQVGDVMIIDDHISFLNLAGLNPLRGANLDSFGPRFPSVTTAYDSKSFDLIYSAAQEAGTDLSILKRGVYVMVGGPSYETNAEVRFLNMIGGSAVGMSTVPEVVCAAHSGVNIVAMSLITNSSAAGGAPSTGPSHKDILEIAQKRGDELERMVFKLVPKLAQLPPLEQCAFCEKKSDDEQSPPKK